MNGLLAVRHVVKRRPFLSIGTAALGVATVGATIEEYNANLLESQQQEQQRLSRAQTTADTLDRNETQLLRANDDGILLPRMYDAEQIDSYWSKRKISIAVRVAKIVSELGPIIASYLWERRQRKQLKAAANASNSNKADANHGNDDEKEQARVAKQRKSAIQLREALTDLGPAFVKLGQQISIRPDLVPPHVLKELQKLCDSVRPIPDDVAMDVIRAELGVSNLDDVFVAADDSIHDKDGRENNSSSNSDGASHDQQQGKGELELVASASLGQVYRGKIKSTGQTVAIKVQRPEMRKSFSLDLFLLRQYGRLLDHVTTLISKQRPFNQAFLTAFARGSYQELDYEAEARNQMEFQRELDSLTGGTVHVPNVHCDLTTERILVSDWVNGSKLADAPPEQIRQLIPLGVELFLIQLLELGKFHADPHPGNLLVVTDEPSDGNTEKGWFGRMTSKGSKPNTRLCLLDFGLVAEVEKEERRAILKAMVHLLQRDFESLIAEDIKGLGFLPHDYDTEKLRPVLLKILNSGLVDASVGADLHRRKATLMDISNELNQLFFDYPFEVPPFFSLVTRGLGLLEGIALTGDPDFDIFQASAPYVMQRGMARLGSKLWSSKMGSKTPETTEETNQEGTATVAKQADRSLRKRRPTSLAEVTSRKPTISDVMASSGGM